MKLNDVRGIPVSVKLGGCWKDQSWCTFMKLAFLCHIIAFLCVDGTIRTLIIVVSYHPLSEIVPEATGKPTKILIMIADPKYGLRYLSLG